MKKSEKKILTFLIILIIILAIIVLIFIFKTQLNVLWHKVKGDTFQYHGMTFQKTKFGNLTMYATNLAIYRPIQDNTLYWKLILRNDPRVLDKNIAANISNKPTRKFYVSFDRYPLECNGSMLSSYKIGEFLDALGSYKKGAFANEELANENNNTYEVKNCSHATDDWSTILLKQSDTGKSYIHQEGQCFVVEIANCETIETTERLILALLDTMKGMPTPEETESNQTNAN